MLDHLADTEVWDDVFQPHAAAIHRIRAMISDPCFDRSSLVRETARGHERGLAHQLLRDGAHKPAGRITIVQIILEDDGGRPAHALRHRGTCS